MNIELRLELDYDIMRQSFIENSKGDINGNVSTDFDQFISAILPIYGNLTLKELIHKAYFIGYEQGLLLANDIYDEKFDQNSETVIGANALEAQKLGDKVIIDAEDAKTAVQILSGC